MPFICRKGFKQCLKTCSTGQCREFCQYVQECCTEYCFFQPGHILTRIASGEAGVFEDAMTTLFDGTDEEVHDVLQNL